MPKTVETSCRRRGGSVARNAWRQGAFGRIEFKPRLQQLGGNAHAACPAVVSELTIIEVEHREPETSATPLFGTACKLTRPSPPPT